MPLDPYSHTPAHAGAQQPGMTGLVKEELLTRPLETGVRVESGEIHIDPILLREEELLKSRVAWTVHGIDQEPHDIELAKGSLGMTLCQVPVVVSMTAGEPMIEVVRSDGTTRRTPGLTLDGTVSAEVFARSGIVEKIIGHVPSELI